MPIYPGYVVAIVASIVTGVPIKWIESRIDNISTTGFARDYHGTGELAADADGRIKALRFTALADHGAFNSHVSATKLPAGLFSICTGSYDIPKAYCRVDAVYTNKAPGGVAYRCSLRVTEAVYLIERMMDVLAQKLGIDKAEIRRRNFVKADKFPYTTSLGWTLDSGNYQAALDKVLKAVDYEGLRKEQARRRADPNARELMGIGVCTFTEIVGAGPTKVCDILGIGLFDSCDIRVNPTGSAIARLGTMSQGQGHATTYAQIIATELGLSSDEIQIEEGDTDKAPYGAGTWGSRSTPVAGAAAAMAARKIRAKAQKIAAHLLEVGEGDLEWEIDRFKVKGNPAQAKTMKEIALAAHTSNLPDGMEKGLDGTEYYDPPNMTFPFGAYCRRGRHRPLHRRDQGAPLLRARRLRHAHQPDDHRGADPWRADRGVRGRVRPGDPVRRERQPPRQQPDGLLPADRRRDAALGDRPHGHAVAAPSDRRQGRGRVAARRRHPVLQQRGRRRLRASRRDAHGHAAHRLPGLAAVQGAGHRQALAG